MADPLSAQVPNQGKDIRPINGNVLQRLMKGIFGAMHCKNVQTLSILKQTHLK